MRRHDTTRDAWHDMTWHDMTWHDMTWHDMTWHDMTWHDMTWHDMTWHGMAWHDMTWHDMTWHDMTWHDMTWHDMTWHDAKMDKGWCTGHLFVLRTTSRHSGTAAMLTGCEPFTRDRTHKSMYQEFELWICVAFTKKKTCAWTLNCRIFPDSYWTIMRHLSIIIHLSKRKKIMISSTSKLLKLQNLAFSEAWSTC